MTYPQKPLVWSAAAVLLLPVVASIARGQVFEYGLEGNSYSGFGSAVSRIGDVDKDGFEDFIVGAPYDGSTSKGAAIVFSGLYGVELAHLIGSNDYSGFGTAVEGRLDLDGDGFNDILVGAPSEGTVLAYSPHSTTKLYKLTGPAGSYFGTSIRSLEVPK